MVGHLHRSSYVYIVLRGGGGGGGEREIFPLGLFSFCTFNFALYFIAKEKEKKKKTFPPL